MAYEIHCVDIDESSDYDDCRCIETTGIPNKAGGTNEYTPEEIHDRIVDGGDEFYVEHHGSKTNVVEAEREGTKYVRTEPTDTSEDNLLEQPGC